MFRLAGRRREVRQSIRTSDQICTERDSIDEVIDGGFGPVGERERYPCVCAEWGCDAEHYT